MGSPGKTTARMSAVNPTDVEVAAAAVGAIPDYVDLPTFLWGILPQALALETSRDSAGATCSSDDPGSLINLIEGQDAIAPVALACTGAEAPPGVTAFESGSVETILAEIEASGLLDGGASSGLALLGVDLEDGSLDPLFSGDLFSEPSPGPTLPFAGPSGFAAGHGAGKNRYLGDLIS